MLAFELLLLNMNDGRLDSSELLTMAVCCLLALAAALYQYLLYRTPVENVDRRWVSTYQGLYHRDPKLPDSDPWIS